MSKRILIVYAKGTAEIYNRQSALGSYIHCLATILVKNGYVVKINDTNFGEEKFVSAAAPPVKGSSALKNIIPAFIKEYLKDKKKYSALEVLYSKLDKTDSFDRVIEFCSYGSDIGARLSRKHKKDLILVYDAPIADEHVFFHKGQLFFKKRMDEKQRNSVLQAASIVVYSGAVQAFLCKKYRKDLPCYIHQNVDYTRFEFIENKEPGEVVNIGFIGSYLKWHRVDLLLKAFTKLVEKGKNVRLFLLGAGLEFDAISKEVKNSKYSSLIEIPGFMDGEKLLAYKKKIHIGVMPGSNWYGAPNKIFEYGAAKMAVVAPATPTISDLFADQSEVLLFREEDLNDLSEKLGRYIDDRQLLNRHAVSLQQMIRENYSETITFEFYNHLIEKQ